MIITKPPPASARASAGETRRRIVVKPADSSTRHPRGFSASRALDPLACPRCGTEMRIVAFITEPPTIDHPRAFVAQATAAVRGDADQRALYPQLRDFATGSRTYDQVPFFYSDLFDLGYEAVGPLDARLEIVADWKEEFREGVVYYLDGGRIG